MRQPVNITLRVLSFVLLGAFVLWVGRQERLGRPALIPNSLWQHKGFSCICFNVFCVWAAFNAFEQYANFFFQDVQGNSPLGTALRFLPAPVSGALANIGVGLLVHRIRGDWIVVLTSIVSALASLLMAIIDPNWSYWRCAFVAQFFNPVGADGMFTVANLLITSMFPPGEQGVAGGVFNTISQTGKSVGMALTLLIAQQVTANSKHEDKTSPEALMVGYRAEDWESWFEEGLGFVKSLCLFVSILYIHLFADRPYLCFFFAVDSLHVGSCHRLQASLSVKTMRNCPSSVSRTPQRSIIQRLCVPASIRCWFVGNGDIS